MYNQNTIKAPPYHQNPGAMNLKYDLNHITKTETADGLDTCVLVTYSCRATNACRAPNF